MFERRGLNNQSWCRVLGFLYCCCLFSFMCNPYLFFPFTFDVFLTDTWKSVYCNCTLVEERFPPHVLFVFSFVFLCDSFLCLRQLTRTAHHTLHILMFIFRSHLLAFVLLILLSFPICACLCSVSYMIIFLCNSFFSQHHLTNFPHSVLSLDCDMYINNDLFCSTVNI